MSAGPAAAGGAEQANEGYRAFLGLASHECFHAWNVKRIKPAAFTPYDLDAENYTTLLWAFEGITSYYDDLMLVRGGLIDEREYLELVGRNITNLVRTPGRLVQSLADASFDAWIKYYRQDENTPNVHVSYCLKGSLVDLALDLAIRGRTDGRRSLDDVMRALWRGHGRTGVGVPEGGVERIAEGIAGFDLKRFFDQALRSTGELPLVKLLASAGVKLAMRSPDTQGDRDSRDSGARGDAPRARGTLDAKTTSDPAGVKLVNVFDGGAAQAAGLSAGDIVIALDGVRVTGSSFDARLGRLPPGARVRAHAFRRDELIQCEVVVRPQPDDTCHLEIDPRAGAKASRLRGAWLKGKKETVRSASPRS